MFRRMIWGIKLLFVLIIGAFVHYTLPQRDIVRITGSEIIRKDFSGFNRWFYASADSGDSSTINRDLRLINTVSRSGAVRVYRNEDTGFRWPPYFKFDSSDLHAEAIDAVSSKELPEWYIMRHYGWRSQLLSIYPNAVSLRPATGPEQRLFPWFNLILLLVLGGMFWAIYVRIRRFWQGRITPLLERLDARISRVFRRKD